MKSVLVYSSVLFLLIKADLQDSERHQIALECIQQVGIDRSVVEEAIAGNMPKNDIKYKKFLACSYKKQKYQNENGEILIENIKKFLQRFYDPSDLRGLNACSGHDGLDHGENAFRALKCVLNHIKTKTPINSH